MCRCLGLYIVFVGFVAASAHPVSGETTTDLYNTGVGASRTPLADGMIGDPHYQLMSPPSGSTTDIRIRREAGGYAIGTGGGWLRDNEVSAWIGPNNDERCDGPGGLYQYRTTFTLSAGFGTAQISGLWASDNAGIDVLINGRSTGNFHGDLRYPGGVNAFDSYAAFYITSGFHAGLNTLDFLVYQDGGSPTGLRVEVSGEYGSFVPIPPELVPVPNLDPPTAVPLPSAALAGIAILGVFGFIRSKHNAAATA